MNLAVTLLVVLAIASVIGTVLRQNEPYENYIIKFGRFWFDVFEQLGLFDVYSSIWFMGILGFLLVSVSVCIYRNGPAMIKDAIRFRLKIEKNSLLAFHNKAQWRLGSSTASARDIIISQMKKADFKIRCHTYDDHIVVAAKKGTASRLGYLFTHIAIVVICTGALIDSNFPLKLAESMGRISIETRSIPASKVPEASVISSDNHAFRGNITLQENTSADFLFLNLRDGYLVQKLPFRIELKDFRIEHYPTGQPKSFESDLVIHDVELDKTLHKTIAVNHPLVYRGYSIYQASFSDGGSHLKIKAWPLMRTDKTRSKQKYVKIKGDVNSELELETPRGPMTLELTDFRKFNIMPAGKDDPSGKKFVNRGPNFTFKLRNAAGEAHEYVNYMWPIKQEGRSFFISGVRGSPAEEFRYLHIPADDKGGIGRFMRFQASLYDTQRLRTVSARRAEQLVKTLEGEDAMLKDQLAITIERVASLFAKGGYSALNRFIKKDVPAEQRATTAGIYMKMLRGVLGDLYVDILTREGNDPEDTISDQDARFFEDAVLALDARTKYGSPFYLQLADFEHVEASGLQIARAPGKNVVYFGSAMLIIGVFLMFYLPYRRYWAWIEDSDTGTMVLLAGSGLRHIPEFHREFEAIRGHLDQHLASLSP